jgi:hypothetical protein
MAMMERWLVVGFLMSGMLAAADKSQASAAPSSTQTLDFPAGGTLRLQQSIGILTIEGWDRPDMEITTTKPEKARISTERKGNDVVVTTIYPRHRFLPRNPVIGGSDFDVSYLIKIPASSSVIAHHQVGEVNVDNLSGDIEVTIMQGQITLHLPQDGQYDINARADYGSVNSDFPGREKRIWFLGHRLLNPVETAAHKLNLRNRFGDIVILKIQVPAEPGPAPAPQR